MVNAGAVGGETFLGGVQGEVGQVGLAKVRASAEVDGEPHFQTWSALRSDGDMLAPWKFQYNE